MQGGCIIYLDVDGVLNRYGVRTLPLHEAADIEKDFRRQEEAARRHAVSVGSMEWWALKIKPECVERLDRIAAHADAVVLSSNWKHPLLTYGIQFSDVLRTAGSTVAASKMRGVTPFLGPRLTELAFSVRELEPQRFVVLDDVSLSASTDSLDDDEREVCRYHVHTRGDVGLTDDDVEKAVGILTRAT